MYKDLPAAHLDSSGRTDLLHRSQALVTLALSALRFRFLEVSSSVLMSFTRFFAQLARLTMASAVHKLAER